MNWMFEQIDALKAQATDYKTIALLEALQQYVDELDVRITQLEGELDGKMWRPSSW